MSKMRFFALQELANRRPIPVEYPTEKLSEYYGAHVFDRKKMQEFLPSEAYKAVINAIEKGKFNPSTILALKISNLFQKSVNEIFSLEEND